jgi:molybdopterin synthase catalytic subunit
MIEITRDKIDHDRVISCVKRDSTGAVVVFHGTTRNVTEGRNVLYLEYEAYRPMADNKLSEITLEIRQRWSIENIAIVHRIGKLNIGETSLVVAVSTPHRKDAFLACQYVVDRIKQTVPIWKKEYFEDGEVWVGSELSSTCS